MANFSRKVFQVCLILIVLLFVFSCHNKPKQVLLQGPFQKETGYCWIAQLPGHEKYADSNKDGQKSTLILYEDGKPLGPPHSLHDDIRTNGKGRYSHWINSIYFSTSDNSDPNSNGKKYTFSLQ
jgi:hypothetical protein